MATNAEVLAHFSTPRPPQEIRAALTAYGQPTVGSPTALLTNLRAHIASQNLNDTSPYTAANVQTQPPVVPPVPPVVPPAPPAAPAPAAPVAPVAPVAPAPPAPPVRPPMNARNRGLAIIAAVVLGLAFLGLLVFAFNRDDNGKDTASNLPACTEFSNPVQAFVDGKCKGGNITPPAPAPAPAPPAPAPAAPAAPPAGGPTASSIPPAGSPPAGAPAAPGQPRTGLLYTAPTGPQPHAVGATREHVCYNRFASPTEKCNVASLPALSANQAYLAHGDVLQNGKCGIMLWTSGKPSGDLKDGTYHLYRIHGITPAMIEDAAVVEQQIAEAGLQGGCPKVN